MAQNHITLALLSLFNSFNACCFSRLSSCKLSREAASTRPAPAGRHAISGRLIFPSGQRADYRLKVKLESPGVGDLTVLSDVNGNFSFRSLTAGQLHGCRSRVAIISRLCGRACLSSPTIPRRAPRVRLVPISRPITLQIYLRPKQQARATNRVFLMPLSLAFQSRC